MSTDELNFGKFSKPHYPLHASYRVLFFCQPSLCQQRLSKALLAEIGFYAFSVSQGDALLLTEPLQKHWIHLGLLCKFQFHKHSWEQLTWQICFVVAARSDLDWNSNFARGSAVAFTEARRLHVAVIPRRRSLFQFFLRKDNSALTNTTACAWTVQKPNAPC